MANWATIGQELTVEIYVACESFCGKKLLTQYLMQNLYLLDQHEDIIISNAKIQMYVRAGKANVLYSRTLKMASLCCIIRN